MVPWPWRALSGLADGRRQLTDAARTWDLLQPRSNAAQDLLLLWRSKCGECGQQFAVGRILRAAERDQERQIEHDSK